MLKGGYIRLHRKITEWEWYHDATVTRVFIHLLLTANYKPKKFENFTVGVGERVISLQGLADETGVSKGTIVRVLNCLEKTGELKRRVTAKFTIITLKNYTTYNADYPQADRSLTDDYPQADRSLTDDYPQADRSLTQWKKDKESKKAKKQEGKKEEGGANAPELPSSPEITIDFLIAEFGKSNLERYTAKVRNWMKRKGISGEPELEMIYKWLDEDKDKLKLPRQNSNSSFDVKELEESSYERYRKK